MNRLSLLAAGVLASLATSVMASNTAPAEQALKTYKEQFAHKDAGVYEGAPYTFFVADQTCIDNQKYAGSKESKLAERKAMTLMAKHALGQLDKPLRSSVGVPGVLGDDIYDWHWQQQQQRAQLRVNSGYRIVDEDTGNCSRRVVYALRSDELKAVVPAQRVEMDISTLQQRVFTKAMESNNFLRLAGYFESLGLYELAIAFGSQAIEARSSDVLLKYPVYVNWNQRQKHLLRQFEQCRSDAQQQKAESLNQLVSFSRSAFCGQPIQFKMKGLQYLSGVDVGLARFSKPVAEGDLQGIVDITLRQHGFLLFDKEYRAPDMKPFNDRAQELFEQGKQPEEIVRLYSYSLNMNPLQPEIWSQLSAVMRAFGLHGSAYAFAMQALMQNPSNADYWLHLANALIALESNEQAERIVQLSTALTARLIWSDWGRNQITKLNNTLKSQ